MPTRERRAIMVVAIVIVAMVVFFAAWWFSVSPAEQAAAGGKIRTILVLGTISSLTWGLLALGFTLIYGVAGVLNFAHSGLYMMGAYLFFAFLANMGYHSIENPASNLLPLAIILATIAVCITSVAIYFLTIHPIIGDILATLVVTVFVAMLIQQWIYLPKPIGFAGSWHAFPAVVEGKTEILGITVTYANLVESAVSLALFLAIATFIEKTKTGSAMRALHQDREMAMLVGINSKKIYMITIALSSATAALAAVFGVSATGGQAQPIMWLTPLAFSFSIVILGGLGSLKGTFVGCFIVGYTTKAVTVLTARSFLGDPTALAIMIIVILARPKGIFGKRVELE